MKYQFLILLSLAIPVFCLSQSINENFCDNDLNTLPQWSGDLQDYITNSSGQLQLSMNTADTSWLSTPMEMTSSMEWKFFIRLNFSPSSLNYSKVFLLSDRQNLNDDPNGFYLRFGESGSNDAVELFHKQGSIVTSILRGPAASISNSFALYVKVNVDSSGTWKLYSGATSSTAQVASGIYPASQSTGFFGLHCIYTSSNASKFYFDDIYAGPQIEDLKAPVVETIIVQPDSIQLVFNETLKPSSIQQQTFLIAGYQGSINPSLYGTSNVLLELSDSLINGNQYNLGITGIKDINGNETDTVISFEWFVPKRFDVVINELMIDPTPSQGLPEFEFIELYNRTNHDIILDNWIVQINQNQRVISEALIPSKGFILLYASSAQSDYQLYGNYAVPAAMSSTGLTNSGATIHLFDERNELIDFISYDDSWYKDESKSEGGFSIERIDPSYTCGGKENWKATLNNLGGTPGMTNSVYNPVALNQFAIRSICKISESSLEIIFNQFIDTLDFFSGDPVIFTPPMLIDSTEASGRYTDRITINTATNFNDDITYELSLNQGRRSCDGNLIPAGSIPFSFVNPKQGDITISEIMADPEPRRELPSIEYIEIINRTNSPFLTGSLQLCNNTSCGTLSCGIINPGEYVILTDVQYEQTYQPYGKVIGVSGMPSITNDGSILVLKNQEGIISTLNYNSEWHDDDSKSDGGFSLEQIDSSNPCAGRSNWKTTRSSKGGTPGKINSVHGSNADVKQPNLKFASVKDSTHLLITFSEPMYSTGITKENLQITPDIGSPLSIVPSNNTLESYLLVLAHSLKDAQIYTITLSAGKDCAGNLLSNHTIQAAIPQMPEPGDLVFNEILFNGRSDETEFIEVYNTSDKAISLSSLELCDIDPISGAITQERTIDTTGFIVFPGEYAAIANSEEIISEEYRCLEPSKVIRSSEALSLESEGAITLLSLEGKVLDILTYSEDMHFTTLKDTKGISLEKGITTTNSLEKSNWHSASVLSGWATPGYRNSQSRDNEQQGDLTIDPEVFTPDQDGANDHVNISFKGLNPGTQANVYIFDHNGLLTKRLAHHQPCGTEGVYSWDGTNDAGEIEEPGIYIVYFETFDPPGTVKKQKKICVLARRN